MNKILYLSITLIGSLFAFNQSFASTQSTLCFEDSCPNGAPSSNFIADHHIFILSANINTLFADWVAYKVESQNLDGPSRSRYWKKDPLLPSGYTLEPDDYKDAHATEGYDRGHQAPLAAFSNTAYWSETNYLSNITPQKSELNQGPWNQLESKVRDLARKYGSLYVITGTLYQSPMPALPNAQYNHEVPSAYWKVILLDHDNTLETASFIMPQTAKRSDSYCSYASDINNVQAETKLSLFPSTPSVIKPASLLSEFGC